MRGSSSVYHGAANVAQIEAANLLALEEDDSEDDLEAFFENAEKQMGKGKGRGAAHPAGTHIEKVNKEGKKEEEEEEGEEEKGEADEEGKGATAVLTAPAPAPVVTAADIFEYIHRAQLCCDQHNNLQSEQPGQPEQQALAGEWCSNCGAAPSTCIALSQVICYSHYMPTCIQHTRRAHHTRHKHWHWHCQGSGWSACWCYQLLGQGQGRGVVCVWRPLLTGVCWS